MISLLLVRHGETTWNREGRLQGQTDQVPLTELGRRQATEAAETLADRLAGVTPLLVSSDLLRARQTTAVIAARLGVTPLETAALREQALGELEGRLAADLHPEPVPEGLDITEVNWGGGESIAEVADRLRGFLRWLAGTLSAAVSGDSTDDSSGDSTGSVVVVSHGDTLRVLCAVLDGRSHREVSWHVIGNAEVIEKHWDAVAWRHA